MVEPSANAMAQVRMKPVMRDMMTKKLMRAAEPPTLAAVFCEDDSSSGVEICLALILRFRVWV